MINKPPPPREPEPTLADQLRAFDELDRRREDVTSNAEPPLDGARFRAVHRLSTAADETLADVGETCERVPPASLAPLLAAGHIEPIDREESR